MRRYEVTFYETQDEERTFIARAVVGATSSYEAARIAYDLLKPRYPEIQPREWLAFYSDKAMIVPEKPSELPLETFETEDSAKFVCSVNVRFWPLSEIFWNDTNV